MQATTGFAMGHDGLWIKSKKIPAQIFSINPKYFFNIETYSCSNIILKKSRSP